LKTLVENSKVVHSILLLAVGFKGAGHHWARQFGMMVLDAFPGMHWPPGPSDCGISALQGDHLSGGNSISAT
jgi:hypothetical protein